MTNAWPDPCPIDGALRTVVRRTEIEVIVRCPLGHLEVIDRCR